MKIFIAGLVTETNSFSPLPTGLPSFEEGTIAHGNVTDSPPSGLLAPMNLWRDRAEKNKWTVVESLAAFAQPGGPTTQAVFDAFVEEITSDLKAAMPVDMVLLTLHGAMIAGDCDDCEGYLLARCREIVGDAVAIGVELDPHCNLSPLMLSSSDIIIAYKEYPHSDVLLRAAEVFDLTVQTALGTIKPVMRSYDCRMISMFFTTIEPIRSFVDQLSITEQQDSILSLSLCHSFPWSDTPHTSAKILAITDDAPALATQTANRLGKRLWDIRNEIYNDYHDINAVLDNIAMAPTPDKPVVLADFADNAGGGAASDATFVLQECLGRGLTQVAFGIFWDPMAVRLCQDAGEGASIKLRLGGKISAMSGVPVDVNVRVLAVRSEMQQNFCGLLMPLGTVVLLEISGIYVVVNTLRTQLTDPNVFTKLGLDLGAMKIIVVKSSNHFYKQFVPISSSIIHLNTPGSLTPNFANIAYTKRDAAYWPNVENPFQIKEK